MIKAQDAPVGFNLTEYEPFINTLSENIQNDLNRLLKYSFFPFSSILPVKDFSPHASAKRAHHNRWDAEAAGRTQLSSSKSDVREICRNTKRTILNFVALENRCFS